MTFMAFSKNIFLSFNINNILSENKRTRKHDYGGVKDELNEKICHYFVLLIIN